MKKLVTLLMLSILCGFSVSGQEQRSCATMQSLEQMMEQNPLLAKKMAEAEEQARIAEAKITPQGRRQAELITIPVVIHILYNTDRQNLSDAQIQSQMEVLNEDFRRLNPDKDNEWSQAADVDIEFCLATVDPNGNPTTGVTRKRSNVTAWSTNDAIKRSSSGGVDAWDTREYLNMWVGNLSGGLLGYAQFPGGNRTTDGVVMRSSSFGSSKKGNGFFLSRPFDLGRTATHEVGHYLGLRHIWGDSNCGNDRIDDTPTQQRSSRGCPVGNNSCGSIDMVQNYMDYSNDSCMNIFTQGQTDRMRAVMTSSRSSLANSNKCEVTVSKPTSGFQVAINCNKATFSNTSTANAVDYSWDFGDGATSTEKNPTHTYASEGSYTVKLEVSNSAGSDLTQTTVQIITAAAPSPVSETICPGESATFALPGNKGYVWYDSATGGNAVGAGSTFETGVLTENTDYFVSGTAEKVVEGDLGIKVINQASGGNHQGGFFLVFDATESFILRKAKVLAEGAGNRTLELKDASDNTIATKVINIPNGESVIDVDLKIAAGSDLKIGFADGANLFRSNANLSYPYVYSEANTDVVTIKGSTASVPTNFYYYLYNWEISSIGNCETENRTKLSVIVEELEAPTLNVNKNTGTMTVDGTYNSYQWFKDGTAISGATSRTYTAPENGVYTVAVSNGTCEAISEEVILSTLSIGSFEWPLGVSIYPNPTREVLNIKGLNTLDSVKQLNIINMLGQTVKSHNINAVLETTMLDVQELSKGLYFLNIDNKYTAKFIVK